jgi:hypothetical protein
MPRIANIYDIQALILCAQAMEEQDRYNALVHYELAERLIWESAASIGMTSLYRFLLEQTREGFGRLNSYAVSFSES